MPSEKNGRKGNAEVAELADAHGSGPCGSNTMRVQVPPPARTENGNSLPEREAVFCIRKSGQWKVRSWLRENGKIPPASRLLVWPCRRPGHGFLPVSG